MTVIDRPIRHSGTPEERAANYHTHAWMTFQYSEDDAETYCDRCCSKPWHAAADYPCGVDVPREVICSECNRGVMHTHTARQAAMLRGEEPA